MLIESFYRAKKEDVPKPKPKPKFRSRPLCVHQDCSEESLLIDFYCQTHWDLRILEKKRRHEIEIHDESYLNRICLLIFSTLVSVVCWFFHGFNLGPPMITLVSTISSMCFIALCFCLLEVEIEAKKQTIKNHAN